jgi:CheY-like chemotaxis protein
MSKMGRVLVVDDEPAVAEFICRALDDAGYETFQAISGVEALDLLESEPLPDLIVCDHRMPGMDGVALKERLEQNPLWAKIPFIMMTSKVSDAAVYREWFGNRITVSCYLTKPFHPVEVMLMVRRILTGEMSRGRRVYVLSEWPGADYPG